MKTEKDQTTDKKFIVTDPCYIIAEKSYDVLLEETGMDIPCKETPFCTYYKKGGDIDIHIIDQTPNGDGGYRYRGEDIGVDSGMLCVAENKDGWSKETFGATFKTLEQAENAFKRIIKHF